MKKNVSRETSWIIIQKVNIKEVNGEKVPRETSRIKIRKVNIKEMNEVKCFT